MKRKKVKKGIKLSSFNSSKSKDENFAPKKELKKDKYYFYKKHVHYQKDLRHSSKKK